MMMMFLIMMIKEPEVEFFNPKLRHELEKKDADIMAKTKLKGAAPGNVPVEMSIYYAILFLLLFYKTQIVYEEKKSFDFIAYLDLMDLNV